MPRSRLIVVQATGDPSSLAPPSTVGDAGSRPCNAGASEQPRNLPATWTKVTQELAQAHALITGGVPASGADRGCAAEGAVVTLAARRLEVLEQGATQIRADVPGCEVRITECDDRDGAGRGGGRFAAPRRSARHRVANAGSAVPGPFLLLDDDAWRFCCELNIVGTASTFKYAALAMRARWIAGRNLDRGFVCTRGVDGRLHVDEGCRRHDGAPPPRELGAFGIRVNAISTGIRAHRGHRRSLHRGAVGRIAERSALKRSEPPTIRALVVHLAQPAGVDHGPGDRRRRGMGVQPMADLSDLSVGSTATPRSTPRFGLARS
jgi:NAD(P)-dependent dehydrogenase (short-subunit alcohol dehydrogenase family)